MKHTLLLFFISVFFSAFAQTANDWVVWKMEYDASKVQKGKTVTVTFSAKVKAGYHVYSATQPAKAVLPLVLVADKKNKGCTFEPFTELGNRKVEFDDIFKADIAYYDADFQVVQKINIKKKKTPIKGVINYQVCNEEMCLPGEYRFEIK